MVIAMIDKHHRQRLVRKAKSLRTQYDRDAEILAANHDEWRARYAGMWIAIHKGKVHGPEDTQTSLIGKLKTLGIAPERAVFHYFAPVRHLRVV